MGRLKLTSERKKRRDKTPQATPNGMRQTKHNKAKHAKANRLMFEALVEREKQKQVKRNKRTKISVKAGEAQSTSFGQRSMPQKIG